MQQSSHRILVGDCIEMMRTLPDQSAHTCITSPPYFGLRDDGTLWLKRGDSYARKGGLGPQSCGHFANRRRGQEEICKSIQEVPDRLKRRI